MSFLSRNLPGGSGWRGLPGQRMIAAFKMLPVSVIDGKKVLA
jgi:hypothetical protein